MDAGFRIAYLINRYPAVSHSFVRREIAAMEAAGATVTRWSVRPPDADLPDPLDQAERAKTVVILAQGYAALVWAALITFVRHPGRTLRVFLLAQRLAGRLPATRVKHVAYFLEACFLFQRFARAPVDHVHVHFGTNPTTVARLLYRLGGPPYSFTAHGPDEFDNPEALDLGGKVADAKLAVAISSYGRSQLMRWSDPAHWPRIVIARCGVDQTYLAEVALAPLPAAPRLCCVARLSAQKGLPLLIEAAAEVRARGIAFELVLVGDGALRPQIEAMIAAHNLNDAIMITGWCSGDTVRAQLLNARAMILPSFAEGLPVVIMEALALQRPVIVSAIAGTPELVDAQCGWLVPAGAVAPLADAMVAALTAPTSQLAAMGAEGRKRVLAQHDAQVNGAHLLEMVKNAHRDTAK